MLVCPNGSDPEIGSGCNSALRAEFGLEGIVLIKGQVSKQKS